MKTKRGAGFSIEQWLPFILMAIVVVLFTIAITNPAWFDWAKNFPGFDKFFPGEEVEKEEGQKIEKWKDYKTIDNYEETLSEREQTIRRKGCDLYEIKWTLDKEGKTEIKKVKKGTRVYMYAVGTTGCKNKDAKISIIEKDPNWNDELTSINSRFNENNVMVEKWVTEYRRDIGGPEYYFKIDIVIGAVQESKEAIDLIRGTYKPRSPELKVTK